MVSWAMNNMRRLKEIICRVLCFIEQRAWFFAAMYLLALLLAAVPRIVVFGNACESKLRIMPELSDEAIDLLNGVFAYYLTWLALWMFLLLILSPLLLLCFKRLKAAGKVLAYNFGGFVVGIILLAVNAVFGFEADMQMRIARINLESKAEAARHGLSHYDRISCGHFRQRHWSYGGGRYEVCLLHDYSTCYCLVDKKWRPMEGTGGRLWEDQVLLEDIAEWSEVDGDLHLLTKTGGRHMLVYAKGKVYEYPDAQHCPQSLQSDEVFENLERRLRNGGCK